VLARSPASFPGDTEIATKSRPISAPETVAHPPKKS